MRIFVFGSNLAGRHGRGSALEAVRNHGAIYGQGTGPQGNAYAIPTKGWHMEVLPPKEIAFYVDRFRLYAAVNLHLTFDVVAIGCGLAGYRPDQIAPLFKNMTPNVVLPAEFTHHVI